MDIQTVKLACFSPTGTSRAVIKAVAQGLGLGDAEMIDATQAEARTKPLRASADDLLVVAVPVYAGRVPVVLRDWLRNIQAEQTPAVCIVVYGNREYEDALLELRDILKQQGAVPLAGAAFIGEHSFSSEKTPIAVGRPDEKDLALAREFGRKVAEKVAAVQSIGQEPELSVPGDFPYKKFTPLPALDFIAVSDECVQCGDCAEACPTGAIAPDDGTKTDPEKCIKCCACIKVCPEGARSMKPSPFMDKAKQLNETCAARKEPELYL